MDNPEKQSLREEVGKKHLKSFEDFASDPKQEGLRPRGYFAGGDPDEIIVIGGKEYVKIVPIRVSSRGSGKGRPYTEKEYWSHETPDVGPGPGWDFIGGYLQKGWGIIDLDPEHLSDLPFYRLEPKEQEQ